MSKISIQPQTGMIDDPLSVKISGLTAGSKITLRCRTKDESGLSWQSYAVYTADKSGEVDLSKQRPESGTFKDADPTALTWSMRLEGENINKPVPGFLKRSIEPLVFSLAVEADGKVLDQTEFTRTFLPRDGSILHQSVREDGLVGTLFYPAAGGPHPVIIVLGGTDGGLSEARGAFPASHGYAVLSLAYFDIDPLPKELAEIPLEYFEKAINWIKKQKNLDLQKLAVLGVSKGGELALLLGATFPEIKAVVAISGSGVVWQGLKRETTSSWTYQGKPIPYVPLKYSFSTILKFILNLQVSLRNAYLSGLKDDQIVETAAIPVENTKGPILMISGGKDALWPSDVTCELAEQRLARLKFTYPYKHLKLKEAGHITGFPYLPAIQLRGNLIFSRDFEPNTRSAIEAWYAIFKFLKEVKI